LFQYSGNPNDDTNFTVYGGGPRAYSASLDDIEAVLPQRQRARP
jgi:hypothetical protein